LEIPHSGAIDVYWDEKTEMKYKQLRAEKRTAIMHRRSPLTKYYLQPGSMRVSSLCRQLCHEIFWLNL
jgi:hypothetical protein